MKNRSGTMLICVSLWFFGLLTGYFLGRNHVKEAVLISVPPQMLQAPSLPEDTTISVHYPIDLNTATQEELMTLPQVGELLAFRIVSYRRERGVFSSKYDLLKIEGITESVIEEIESLICIGGQK